MHRSDIRLTNYRIGELRLDPTQIRGEGGPLTPSLVLPMELDLHQPDEKMLVIERLEATLWTQPATGPRARVGLPAVVDSAGRGDTRPLHSLPRGASHHFELRIELLETGVRLLDEQAQRSAQGPIPLTLYCEARAGLSETSAADELPSLGRPEVWAVRRFWSVTIEELQLQLAREHWAEQVAPALGHDHLRLIAVQMPLPDGALGSELVGMFDAAGRAYDASDWRETVQKCRDVRHHIEESVRSEPNERVFQAVARLVGADEKDPRMKFLDDAWRALVDLTSEAHHIGSIGRLDAATAHASLLLTATLIQYLGELLSPL
jgi:hypothetical protein